AGRSRRRPNRAVQPPAAAVLGIAPHSGWAAAVLLAGTPAAPRVILRERLELSDARLGGSKQPYHALEGLPLAQASQAVRLRGAQPRRASSVNDPSAAKRPILPRRFLETDHHVFGIQARALRQAAEDVGQDLLLHLDAAAHRQQYLDQDEIVRPASAEIGVLRIKVEVIRAELQHALKAVLLGHARSDQRAMHRIEHHGLEFTGLAFADGERD